MISKPFLRHPILMPVPIRCVINCCAIQCLANVLKRFVKCWNHHGLTLRCRSVSNYSARIHLLSIGTTVLLHGQKISPMPDELVRCTASRTAKEITRKTFECPWGHHSIMVPTASQFALRCHPTAIPVLWVAAKATVRLFHVLSRAMKLRNLRTHAIMMKCLTIIAPSCHQSVK